MHNAGLAEVEIHAPATDIYGECEFSRIRRGGGDEHKHQLTAIWLSALKIAARDKMKIREDENLRADTARPRSTSISSRLAAPLSVFIQ